MTYIPEDGHRRWAKEATTHQGTPGGPGAPRWVGHTWWSPSGSYSPRSFILFGVVQNRWPDVAFPGPDFQLSEFSPLVHTLHIMREKALELLQKALLYNKTT